MKSKIWRVEDIWSQLIAVQTGLEARVPVMLLKDNNEVAQAYHQGCKIALKYFAEQFGLDIESNTKTANAVFQTKNLGLRTWVSKDIVRVLEVASLVMTDAPSITLKQNEKLAAFYRGKKETLQLIAISFGVKMKFPPEITSISKEVI